MISQYFIGGMMPESANPAQQSVPIIEIRPFRGSRQGFGGLQSELVTVSLEQQTGKAKSNTVGGFSQAQFCGTCQQCLHTVISLVSFIST